MDVKAINLRTLKRIDPNIKDIVLSSSQSALYTFDLKTEKFIKNEIEGSLHVFRKKRRMPIPSPGSDFGFIILDMSSTKHFMEDLKRNCVIQTVKYHPHNLLLFTSVSGSVHCLWFEDEDECQNMHQVIKSCSSQ